MDLYKGMIKHIEELNELDSGAGMKLGMQEMGDLTDNGPLQQEIQKKICKMQHLSNE